MAPAAFEDPADLRLIVLQAPHVLAFFYRYDGRPRLCKNARPRGPLRERARYVHRTQSLLKAGFRGASNIGSINVQEITQLRSQCVTYR